MKVSKEQAAQNRARILEESARLFRQHGFSGVGMDALAEAAGMTHGNLYSQFGSKEGLMAEAVCQSQMPRGEANATCLRQFISRYLSARHRDNPGKGCFIAALGCEMSRQRKPVRQSFTKLVRTSLTRFANLISDGAPRKRENEALVILSTMVGAMILSRAVSDPELSDRILAVSRTRLLKDN